ncbi:MAG TPA: AAA family ATPase [Stellaceae bacterium]|nr:AAA family ATPase [Stellaceae bacterium]
MRRSRRATPAANGRGAPESSRNPLQLVHFRDMRARLDGRPLVKGMLDCQQTSLIVGETGSGKTFLAIDLALHVAAALPWFGRKVMVGPVIYVAAEAGRGIANRVAVWRDHHHTDEQDIPFAAITSPIDLCHADAGDVDRLIATIREAGLDEPVLIIIDTVSRVLAGGNENGPDDMGALVRSLDRLRDELRCHVCAVHHLGKDATRGGRGHSLLRCAVDTEIAVARNGNAGIATATVTKQRDGIAGEAVAFRLRPVELGRDADGDPVTSCIAEPVEGATDRKPTRGLPASQKRALELLSDAIARAGEIPPADNHIPAEVPCVGEAQWRECCYQGMISDSSKPETKQKAFKRAADTLLAAGRIGKWGDLVWLVQP